MRRLAGIVLPALALTVVAAPVRAQAIVDEVPREHLLAVGVKAGILPPIFTVVEVVTRPRPMLTLGLFGMYTNNFGLGHGAARISVGGEAAFEFHEGRRGTPYVSIAYDYYHASPDAQGNWEISQVAYLTAGYVWKSPSADVYLGGGLLILLSDELPACTGICLSSQTWPLLPTVELGVRFAFL